MTTLKDQYDKLVGKYSLRVPTSQMIDKNKKYIISANCYIEEHPETIGERVADFLGIDVGLLRKWQERGYVIKTAIAAKRTLTDIKSGVSKQKDVKAPYIENMLEEKQKAREEKKRKKDLAIPLDPNFDDDEDLSIREIRQEIKRKLTESINNPSAVAQYAQALKTLSTVSDKELEEDYEDDTHIKIYVPDEREEEPKIVEIDRDEF